jgi:hypothetical protein
MEDLMENTEFKKIQRRIATCTVQTRCDKRTLATIYLSMKDNNIPANSISGLVKTALEMLEDIIKSKYPQYLVLSSEDADDILTSAFNTNLHPKGKYGPTFLKQLQKEDAYLEGRAITTAEPRKVTKRMSEVERAGLRQAAIDLIKSGTIKPAPTAEREVRLPDNVVLDDASSPEELRDSVIRQHKRTSEEKSALAAVPTDIITNNTNNNTNTNNSNNSNNNKGEKEDENEKE